ALCSRAARVRACSGNGTKHVPFPRRRILRRCLTFSKSAPCTSAPVWQARRESNPQPAVLETAALPIELLAYIYPQKCILHFRSRYARYTPALAPETDREA